jgi:hypothetical protein
MIFCDFCCRDVGCCRSPGLHSRYWRLIKDE